MTWTTIANDFVLDKPDPTEEEVSVRMKQAGWKIFCKDPNVEANAPAPPGFDPKACLVNMRDLAINYMTPRILALFAAKMQAFEPDY